MPFILAFVLFYSNPLNAQDVFPQRIVSLGPTITEELYLLNVEEKIVGVTLYCQRPLEAQEKEKVGTVREINIEKVVSLKPDLVLATSLAEVKAKEKLKALGLKVVSFSYAKNFRELCEHFLKLGEIIGKGKEADEIVRQAKSKVEFIKKETINLYNPKVFIQIGAKPLYTVNKDSFLNDFIELAGGTNIAVNAGSGLYSQEMVLKQNPDVIIIVTMGVAGEEEKKNWQSFRTLNAIKNHRIFIIDSYKFCSPTPVSFVEGLEEMVKILHPHE